MSMIIAKRYKAARRLGSDIHEKTQTQKFTLSQARRAKAKGKGKRPRGGSRSDYAIQFLEKQKIRFTYGIQEKQFRNYVVEASSRNVKGTSPALELYTKLELRLDNVVYRMGLAPTRPFARQLVSHGHILVNGRKVTTPSYRAHISDVITIREGSRKIHVFQELDKKLKNHTPPAWIHVDAKVPQGTIKEKPSTPDPLLQIGSVIEFYSR
jgi:small subunit ribosomal protein S4